MDIYFGHSTLTNCQPEDVPTVCHGLGLTKQKPLFPLLKIFVFFCETAGAVEKIDSSLKPTTITNVNQVPLHTLFWFAAPLLSI